MSRQEHQAPRPLAKRFSPWRLLLPLLLAALTLAGYWDVHEFRREQQPLVQALEASNQMALKLQAGQAGIVAQQASALDSTRALAASIAELMNSCERRRHTL